jgi:outer membrane beta-barrel protein
LTTYKYLLIAALMCLVLLPGAALAQEETSVDKRLSQQPLVQPNVVRRIIDKVAIDTENLEMGFLFGIYSAEDFGTNPVTGFRLAYHITEDVFFEASLGQTETSKTSAEIVNNLQFIADDERNLTYYNLNVGYNLLPGEVFIGESWAFNISLYLLGGIGNTTFNGEDRGTVVTGGGIRILATDWMAFHMDVRDHVFRQNIFSVEKTTHNIEVLSSITFYF